MFFKNSKRISSFILLFSHQLLKVLLFTGIFLFKLNAITAKPTDLKTISFFVLIFVKQTIVLRSEEGNN